MNNYLAPTKDMQFIIKELAGIAEIAKLPGYEYATDDLAEAILEEAGRFASEVLAPLNTVGDQQGAQLIDGKVKVADGFPEAYRQFIENGWLGLGQAEDIGGQGLPHLLSMAVSEMWNSANLSFAACPILTVGAIQAIQGHASEELKSTYLQQMVQGEWTGTMNLTEPQAGSDLSAIRSKAIPNGDHYLIDGQKIYITWGDHEMTENVIHLVLARLPDAPEGVKGISMFIVPKYLVNEDGSLGAKNDVRAVSLEHKLGIHASPTCAMSFGDDGGAIGYLVGEPNQGLSYMFTMMNHARLSCGLQGVALAERAYQQAVEFARTRVQGFAPGHEGRVAIIQHADVRRMLMLMRSLTEAMRSLTYVTAGILDKAHRGETSAEQATQQAKLELLTPVVKAWCTEVVQEVTTLGIQVHGGMGFIEETGAAQHFRDARITTIYEGTTGIQAADLVGRKILRDGGGAIGVLLEEIAEFTAAINADHEGLNKMASALDQGRQIVAEAVESILNDADKHTDLTGAVSVNFLMLLGTVLGGWQLLSGALVAQAKLDAGEEDSFYTSKVVYARFYLEQVMPRARAYADAVLAGQDAIMELSEELL